MSDNKKILLVLLWLVWPAGLIWYLVDDKMKKDKFVKHHFKQWLVALIAMFAGYFAAGILTFVLIGLLLYPVLGILSLVWFIQALVFIIKGEKKELWLIGKYAEKLTF